MIYSKIKVLHSHGWQYIPDLNDVTLTEEFRGRPELTATEDMADVEAAAKLCPTGAISAAPFSLDLGRCLFCGECALRAPRNIRFTNDYKIGSTSREALVVTPETKQIDFHPELVRKEIPKLFSRSLKLRQVSAAGDASIEMELNATGNVNFDFGRYGVEFTASPRHSDGVVRTSLRATRYMLCRYTRAEDYNRLRLGGLFWRTIQRKQGDRPSLHQAASRRFMVTRCTDTPDDVY